MNPRLVLESLERNFNGAVNAVGFEEICKIFFDKVRSQYCSWCGIQAKRLSCEKCVATVLKGQRVAGKKRLQYVCKHYLWLFLGCHLFKISFGDHIVFRSLAYHHRTVALYSRDHERFALLTYLSCTVAV